MWKISSIVQDNCYSNVQNYYSGIQEKSNSTSTDDKGSTNVEDLNDEKGLTNVENLNGVKGLTNVGGLNDEKVRETLKI